MSTQVITVTRQYQDKINAFARKHQNNMEIKSELAKLKLELEKLQDAMDEIELHDDEEEGKTPYQMGDLYVFLSQEETEEYIKGEEAAANERKGKLEGEKAENDVFLAKLKAELYSKFGKEINLDDERD